MARRLVSGFTLVEIMMVVVIVGILASIAISAFERVRSRSIATRLANDFRIYRDAFETFALEEGRWPPDSTPSVVPAGMEGRLNRFWEESQTGDKWDWEYRAVGVTAGISLQGVRTDRDTMEIVDDILDDGNLATGTFRSGQGNRYTWIMEP